MFLIYLFDIDQHSLDSLAPEISTHTIVIFLTGEECQPILVLVLQDAVIIFRYQVRHSNLVGIFQPMGIENDLITPG